MVNYLFLDASATIIIIINYYYFIDSARSVPSRLTSCPKWLLSNSVPELLVISQRIGRRSRIVLVFYFLESTANINYYY